MQVGLEILVYELETLVYELEILTSVRTGDIGGEC